jgi:hypothetical protein
MREGEGRREKGEGGRDGRREGESERRGKERSRDTVQCSTSYCLPASPLHYHRAPRLTLHAPLPSSLNCRCVELYSEFPALGRILVRDGASIVATGVVKQLVTIEEAGKTSTRK